MLLSEAQLKSFTLSQQLLQKTSGSGVFGQSPNLYSLYDVINSGLSLLGLFKNNTEAVEVVMNQNNYAVTGVNELTLSYTTQTETGASASQVSTDGLAYENTTTSDSNGLELKSKDLSRTDEVAFNLKSNLVQFSGSNGGTPFNYNMPLTNGLDGQVLMSDGAGNTTWTYPKYHFGIQAFDNATPMANGSNVNWYLVPYVLNGYHIFQISVVNRVTGDPFDVDILVNGAVVETINCPNEFTTKNVNITLATDDAIELTVSGVAGSPATGMYVAFNVSK